MTENNEIEEKSNERRDARQRTLEEGSRNLICIYELLNPMDSSVGFNAGDVEYCGN